MWDKADETSVGLRKDRNIRWPRLGTANHDRVDVREKYGTDGQTPERCCTLTAMDAVSAMNEGVDSRDEIRVKRNSFVIGTR